MAWRLALIAVVVLAAGCGHGSGATDKVKPQAPAPARAGDFVGIYADDVFFGDAAYKRAALARQHVEAFS